MPDDEEFKYTKGSWIGAAIGPGTEPEVYQHILNNPDRYDDAQIAAAYHDYAYEQLEKAGVDPYWTTGPDDTDYVINSIRAGNWEGLLGAAGIGIKTTLQRLLGQTNTGMGKRGPSDKIPDKYRASTSRVNTESFGDADDDELLDYPGAHATEYDSPILSPDLFDWPNQLGTPQSGYSAQSGSTQPLASQMAAATEPVPMETSALATTTTGNLANGGGGGASSTGGGGMGGWAYKPNDTQSGTHTDTFRQTYQLNINNVEPAAPRLYTEGAGDQAEKTRMVLDWKYIPNRFLQYYMKPQEVQKWISRGAKYYRIRKVRITIDQPFFMQTYDTSTATRIQNQDNPYLEIVTDVPFGVLENQRAPQETILATDYNVNQGKFLYWGDPEEVAGISTNLSATGNNACINYIHSSVGNWSGLLGQALDDRFITEYPDIKRTCGWITVGQGGKHVFNWAPKGSNADMNFGWRRIYSGSTVDSTGAGPVIADDYYAPMNVLADTIDQTTMYHNIGEPQKDKVQIGTNNFSTNYFQGQTNGHQAEVAMPPILARIPHLTISSTGVSGVNEVTFGAKFQVTYEAIIEFKCEKPFAPTAIRQFNEFLGVPHMESVDSATARRQNARVAQGNRPAYLHSANSNTRDFIDDTYVGTPQDGT
jgi:hypothetical protein